MPDRPASPPTPAARRSSGDRALGGLLGLLGLVAIAACVAFAVALGLRPLAHDDLFWQLRSGAWMARHAAVPHADLFSFTRPGAPWVTHEWGFALLAHWIFRIAGIAGLRALTALVAVGIFAAVAWRTALAAGRRRGEGALPLVPLLAGLCGLGLWMVAAEIFLRAALVGELLLALVLLALTAYGRSGRRRYLAAVVALFFVWANLHSGVVFGLFLLALYALEPLVTRLFLSRGPRVARLLAHLFEQRDPRPYLWTLAAAFAASLVNPNGVEALLYPFRLSRILFASGIEWDLGHFSTASPTHNPGFLLLSALLLSALWAALWGALSRRRAGGGPPLPLAELASVVAFFGLTLWIPRLVFDFAVVALPVLGGLLLASPAEAGAPMETAAAAAGAPSRFRALLLPAGIAAVLALAAARAWGGYSPRPLSRAVPEGGARFLAGAGIRGRMFNHQNFGGFLGWRLGEAIFWDGRNDVFASLVREVTTTPFGEIAARYGVDHLVLAENEHRDLQPVLAAGGWGLVYWDDDCAVYLRRGVEFAPLLARYELRLFPPFGGEPGLRELALDPARAPAVRRELDQVLGVYGENQRALYFEGVMSLYQRDLPRARRELAAAARLGPSEQVDLALESLAEAEAARPRVSR